MIKPKNIDEYILSFPKDIGIILSQIRNAISKAVPEAKGSNKL